MREETVHTDLTVIGGGLAGVCAAIAAARLGARVALVQNRPVLGGNSSSEVRVWVVGATAHGKHRYARENGIIGEMLVENQYRNPEGNPYYWDLVVLEAVRAEPNIELFLNTDVREVTVEGDSDSPRISAVTGWMMGSERLIRFESPAFADCTGDGLVGHLAGARYRIGRESRAEYGEPWAPEIADDLTLGSTMLFYTKDLGRPVTFVPPEFAIDVTKTPIPDQRIIRADHDGCHYWWIEWGGEVDTVGDNERIRDELWAVIYGVWDHIKNSGRFPAAETLTLEWVGSVPGKREYRRFVGDYTLTQHDILRQTEFDDRVGFGGWSIDLHPPGGVYATERASKHWHSDGVYHIPLRCLYSSNVENLWFAGRNISASHVAFGTTRVMATCAVVGQAAGTAAALALAKGVTPRGLAREHVPDLQQVMLRADAALLGVANTDQDDLARRATVTASSTLDRLDIGPGTGRHPLDTDIGLILPVDPELSRIGLLVAASPEAASPVELVVEVYDTERPQNYVPHAKVALARQVVEPGEHWVDVDLAWRPAKPGNAFVVVRAAPGLEVLTTAARAPGVLSFAHREIPYPVDGQQPLLEWLQLADRRSFCVRVDPPTEAYRPATVAGGYARPYAGPQMWASGPMRQDSPEWVELRWPEPVAVGQVELVFDDDVDEDLINLHLFRTPFDVLPTLVRDYRIEAEDLDGGWTVLAVEAGNRRRHRVHPVGPVTTTALRVVVLSTNGAPRAHVVSVRAYHDQRLAINKAVSDHGSGNRSSGQPT